MTLQEVLVLLEPCPNTHRVKQMHFIEDLISAHEGLDFAYGATRLCVFDKSWDFVLKISRAGSMDYNKMEADNYETAKKYHVERLLLPTTLCYTTANGMDIYRQPRYTISHWDALENDYARVLERRYGNLVRHQRVRKIRNRCYCGSRIDGYWMARVLQLYGKKFCKSFEMFTQECQINDLHEANLGWKDGRPIILDYAGYRG